MVAGQQDGGREATLAVAMHGHVGVDEQIFDVRGQLRAADDLGARRVSIERGAPQDGGRAAHHGRVQAHAFVDLGQSFVAPFPDIEHGRVIDAVGLHHHCVVVDGNDGSHLQLDRRDRLAVDQQPPGSVAVGGHDQPSVAELVGCARHELDPAVVVIGEEHGGVSGGRVGFQHLLVVLVARLNQHQQAFVRRPLHYGQVGESVLVPGDLDASAVEGQHVELDLGVRRAGRRIANLSGLLARICGVGDVPPIDR